MSALLTTDRAAFRADYALREAAPQLLATLDDILTSCTVIFPQHMAGEHSAALALVARLKGGDA